MRTTSKLAGAAMVVAVTAAGLAALPSAAFAVSNSNCTDADVGGTMCYYYHSNYVGALAAISVEVDDLYTWTFSGSSGGSSDGKGKAVANDAGSGRNRDTHCTAVTWEHVGGAAGGGAHLSLARFGGQSATLGALNNNNRSLAWTSCNFDN